VSKRSRKIMPPGAAGSGAGGHTPRAAAAPGPPARGDGRPSSAGFKPLFPNAPERSANLHAAAPGLAALCTAGPASSAAARFSPTSPILGKAGAVPAVPRSFKGQPREGESHFKVVELSLQGGGREGGTHGDGAGAPR